MKSICFSFMHSWIFNFSKVTERKLYKRLKRVSSGTTPLLCNTILKRIFTSQEMIAFQIVKDNEFTLAHTPRINCTASQSTRDRVDATFMDLCTGHYSETTIQVGRKRSFLLPLMKFHITLPAGTIAPVPTRHEHFRHKRGLNLIAHTIRINTGSRSGGL